MFEDLLPEPYNGILLDLLFVLAEWHALAKLRLHTESTLNLLNNNTRSLGQLLRRFQNKVCAAYPNTRELDKEEAARGRRQKGKQTATTSTTKKVKSFNWITYKFHALGDYVPAIRWFGTTDSYSTQTASFLDCLLDITKKKLII